MPDALLVPSLDGSSEVAGQGEKGKRGGREGGMREGREGRREGRGGLRTRPKTTKMPVMAQTVAERMTGNWALSAVDSSMGRIIPIPSKQYTETPASNEQGR